ncbi:hypothetical protein ABH15_00955 [Methanoculleus taiwanensis]|uniref:Nucleotide-binding protein n=1 Tax=Methanoculleus taiwanensis TaxID=1550565 RepID=A0A498H232_9EURY|nr:hypothetical protein [Methanoculleus taiwanensis]RXE56773.1 hypothetical protein ABH15_00955 [Methanoculleus taiwanensis]
MLERQERTALILLVLVVTIVLAAHLLLDTVAKPLVAAPYSETVEDGTLVMLEGSVDAVSVTRTGGHLLLSVAGVPVFVPAGSATGLDLHEGDPVFIYGTVQTYRGEKEVVVNSPGDIRILR